jgi:hypothetical protein
MKRLLEWWRANQWRVGAGALAVALVSSPWWGRYLITQLAYFRVRKVEIVGVRYLAPNEILKRLSVDTTASVWNDPEPLEARVARHPQVRSVRVTRKLPGTLVVTVEENYPVALVQGGQGLRAYDAGGRELPLDPSRVAIDLPIVMRRDATTLRLLGDLRDRRPSLFSRVSDVRRVGKDELLWHIASLSVRTMGDVTVDRLAEVFPVEADLAKRRALVAELDLRYRDQVIARLQ